MKNRRTISCFLTLAILMACADDSRLPAREIYGDAMGTRYQVIVIDPAANLSLQYLRTELQQRIDEIENIASTYRDTSDISKFNQNRSLDWVDVSSEFCAMVEAAVSISRETGGAFDITIGSLVNLWGFGPDFKTDELPREEEIARALADGGVEHLQTDCGNALLRKSAPDLHLDLSAWAKGYAVDELAEILDSAGVANYLVEIGGELRVRGQNPDRKAFAIAVERPDSTSKTNLSILALTNTGIATSGDYRNYFEHDGIRYSHAIDPRTGRPVHHALSAVTVIHPSAAYADAIATALLVLGPDDGMRFAVDHTIAAYLAVAGDDGMTYLSSPAFDQGNYLKNAAEP